MNDEHVTARAAELAELILDEVSSSHQDWGTISSWARRLGALADGAAAGLPAPPERREFDRVAAAFRALGHPTRLRILDALRRTEALSPSQLARQIDGDVALGNVAHHTRELVSMGLIAPAGTRPVRGALEHFYRLAPRGRELLGLVDRVAA